MTMEIWRRRTEPGGGQVTSSKRKRSMITDEFEVPILDCVQMTIEEVHDMFEKATRDRHYLEMRPLILSSIRTSIVYPGNMRVTIRTGSIRLANDFVPSRLTTGIVLPEVIAIMTAFGSRQFYFVDGRNDRSPQCGWEADGEASMFGLTCT